MAAVSKAQDNAPGVLVTFEGGDGAGKSTHIRFLADVLEACGREVVCVREPGGTNVGEQLRQVVLDPANSELSSRAELLIYEAARAQLVDEVIAPALAAGKVVLCDRFTDSTLAYQGYGRGLSLEFIREANAFATDGIVPDATIVLTCPDREEKKSRVDRRIERAGAEGLDRLEMAGDDFHTRVIEAFGKLAEESGGRIHVVETAGKHSQTALAIFAALSPYLPCLTDGACDLSQMLADYDAAHDHSRKAKEADSHSHNASFGREDSSTSGTMSPSLGMTSELMKGDQIGRSENPSETIVRPEGPHINARSGAHERSEQCSGDSGDLPADPRNGDAGNG